MSEMWDQSQEMLRLENPSGDSLPRCCLALLVPFLFSSYSSLLLLLLLSSSSSSSSLLHFVAAVEIS